MLFLLFQLGNDRYAISTAGIIEIVPLVKIKRIPHAPPAIAGAMAYRGTSVPVIDLNQLLCERASQQQLSTRIVLVHYPARNGEQRILGLLAEHVTDTMEHDPEDFQPSGVTIQDAPYLGPVITDANGLLQWLDPEKLLPVPVVDALFQELAGA